MPEQSIETSSRAINIDKIKALGNKDRIKILDILNTKGPRFWTELERELQINPNSLNFHLIKLLHSELIKKKVVENDKGQPGTQYSILPEGKRHYETMVEGNTGE